MELFYILLTLLVATRVFGEVAVRLRQPALVGELTAGIALGVLAQQFSDHMASLAELPDNDVFGAITDLGIFFLMLLAGVEMRPRELKERGSTAMLVAIGGIVAPLLLGFGLAVWWLPDTRMLLAQSLVVGLALSITAVPVSVSVLMQLNALRSKIGNVIVGAAVFDDVLSLLVLAVVMSLAVNRAPLSLATLALIGIKILTFFAVTLLAGHWLLPRLGRTVKRVAVEQAEISLLIAWGLFIAVLGELLELHFAVGAFAAGLMFRRDTISGPTYARLQKHLEALTVGFLAPLFFASIGLRLNPAAVTDAPAFVLAMILAAFVGKLLGAGVAARLAGFSPWESFAVGAGMNARGAVAVVVASLALEAGVFDSNDATSPELDNLYSAVVIMAIVTTLLSPMLLRFALHARPGLRDGRR